jgi:putative DNA primase/helicase
MPVQTKTPTLGGAWAARKVFSDQIDLEIKLADQILAQTGASSSIIADGDIHRLDHPDGSRGNKRVWYVCHHDFAVWGDWATGEQHNVFGDGPHDPEKAERARQEARQRKQERRLEQARKHAQAMDKAQAALHNLPWADPLHHYLVRKKIEPFSLRQEGSSLVAFMTDGHGVIGYQTISPDGDKRFLAGTAKCGAYWPPP